MPDINDLIATGIRPPDILGAQQHAATLADLAQRRSMEQQQMAANAQQMQIGQVDLQEKQRQLDRSRNLDQQYQGALTVGADGRPTIDRTKLSQGLAASGNGSMIQGVFEGLDKMDKAHADLAEAKSKVQDLETAHEGELGATIRAGGYDPRLLLTSASQSFRRGHVDEATVSPLLAPIAQALQDDPSGAQAKALTQQLADRWIAGSPKQRELDTSATSAAGSAARGAAATTQAGITTQKEQDAKDTQLLNGIAAAGNDQQLSQAVFAAKQAGLSPQAAARVPSSAAELPAFGRSLMSAEQRTQADQAATNATRAADQAAETARHNSVDEKQGAGRLGVEQKRVGIESQRYAFDANGGVSPAAKMAAAGQMDPQTLRMMIRGNPGFIQQVKAADPNFDEADIDNRFNTLKEFTSTSTGKAGGQVLALNTLIHHADLYLQTADALKNGSFVPGNAAYNAVASAFGSAPPTNAALVGRFLAGETGKVATGGVPAEGEINGILSKLGTNASPDQIRGAAQTLLGIAAGRMQPLQERVNNAKIGNVVQVLGPDAKSILSRRGFDPATMKPSAGAGTVVTKQDVSDYATKHNLSYADAESHVKTNGFVVK